MISRLQSLRSTWTWFPSWHELRTHYFKEVGFLACLAQMVGATVFVSTHLVFLNFHLISVYTSYGNVGKSYSSVHYSYNQIICYFISAFTSTFCFSNCRHFHFIAITVSCFRISFLRIWLNRASLDQPSSTMLTPHQWISGFTALPPIYNRLTTVAAQNGAYWAPQVIGGTGFIVSGTLFMMETQQKWYLPAPKVLGWHIGVWNLIGVRSYTLGPLFTC
jgi:hypothetical protein